MALDLRPNRPFLNELILVDTCEVWRDPEGATDDVADPNTGSITSSSDQVLLETVQCKIRAVLRGFPEMRGGQPTIVSTHELSKPGDTNALFPGDTVKIIVSPHHPELVGKLFRVSENLHSSLGIFIKARLELRERPHDRP